MAKFAMQMKKMLLNEWHASKMNNAFGEKCIF